MSNLRTGADTTLHKDVKQELEAMNEQQDKRELSEEKIENILDVIRRPYLRGCIDTRKYYQSILRSKEEEIARLELQIELKNEAIIEEANKAIEFGTKYVYDDLNREEWEEYINNLKEKYK